MKARRWVTIGIEWTVILLLAVFLQRRFSPQPPQPPTRANARSFVLTGLDGRPISPDRYAGKAILLNYWAPWCPPCRVEIPWLQKLQAANRDSLVVVGVVDDSSEYTHAATMMRQKGITYLLARDSPSLQQAFGEPRMLPTTFYLSPSSHVVHTVTGLVPESMMRRYTADAIGQK